MKKLEVGVNDLETWFPDIAKEWNYDKNPGMTPRDITGRSTKKVWWKCLNCGYEYKKSPNERADGSGCGVCANKVIWVGHNDLATTNPELVKEWDYEQNEISPQTITKGSNKKVWWKCSLCGNSWKAYVYKRNRGNEKCPQCFKRNHTSLPEQVLFYYLSKVFPDAINSYQAEWLPANSEIDIYIPSINLGIEFDGKYWHSNSKRDVRKGKCIAEKGIRLLRLREEGADEIDDCSDKIYFTASSVGVKYIESIVDSCFKYIADITKIETPLIDIENDYLEILANYESGIVKRSLAVVNPILAEEWCYEKNKGLTPKQVNCKTTKKVWWKCKTCGYVWKARVSHRNDGHGCEMCGRKKVGDHNARIRVTEDNNFEAYRPDLVKYWNYEENGDVSPQKITPHSGQRLNWKCPECGYEWRSSISNIVKTNGCRYCKKEIKQDKRNKTIITGGNTLAEKYPSLLSEWDFKNNTLNPYEVAPHSEKKAFWVCEKCGHAWKAYISNRTKGSGGPVCGVKESSKKHGYSVMCVETNERFDSITEAAKKYGISRKVIKKSAEKKDYVAGGYHWRFCKQ